MAKRIALFLDGTWNNVCDNTNVWRLKSLCARSPEQLAYYSAGVGTQSNEHLSGGMFGIGINEEVISAYEWLIENYEQHAQLFIFGFSRGAFTARSLAGFISKCGLLRPGSPVSMKQLFERYRKGTAQSVRALGKVVETDLPQEDQWIKEYYHWVLLSHVFRKFRPYPIRPETKLELAARDGPADQRHACLPCPSHRRASGGIYPYTLGEKHS